MKVKKYLGQNFLIDKSVVKDLVEAADVEPKDIILEVGAGTGVVTAELAKRAGKVIAFEIDKDLIPKLKTNLEGFKNVEIINQDFLKWDIRIQGYPLKPASYALRDTTKYKVVGSIPYQITSPLIHKLLMAAIRPPLIAIVVQKEVAEKITAQPPKATYLSNFVKAFGKAEIVRLVPPKAFQPPPEVWSAILRIELKDTTIQGYKDIRRFIEFLHQGFAYPRKMMRKKFKENLLEKVGISPTRRAESLRFEEWLKLYELLKGEK